MRLYVTPSGRWAGTQADARALAREEGTGFEQREVPTDKEGLLCFLNCHAVKAMSDGAAAMIAPALPVPPAPAAPQAPPAPSYAATSLATDEAFEALPLARQLHLAALALENARGRIKGL